MIVNAQALDLVYKGFKTKYTSAYLAAKPQFQKIAMTVQSGTRDETYGWLGQWPEMREWLTGEREIKSLEAHGFTIVNRKFESTISVTREQITDDRLGVFGPMLSEMGHRTREHPDRLVFDLVKSGFAATCYDGQYFFDTDHPSVAEDGTATTVSNVQTGTEPAWYLFDASRAIKPIIWQERETYDFQAVTAPNDHRVFMTDEYLYGVRARVNAGFGLWHLAYASKAALNEENYDAARVAMQMLRGDKGRLLGVKPTLMVVPPQLERAALHLLNTETKDGGGSNPYRDTCELVVTPHIV